MCCGIKVYLRNIQSQFTKYDKSPDSKKHFLSLSYKIFVVTLFALLQNNSIILL